MACNISPQLWWGQAQSHGLTQRAALEGGVLPCMHHLRESLHTKCMCAFISSDLAARHSMISGTESLAA